MNASPHFRFYFALFLLLLLGLTVRVHATAPPSAPRRAQETTSRFTHSLGLSAGQAAQLQAPVLRLVRERDSLAQHYFASAAEVSAAHTVVEYHFFAAVAGILTANQFDDLIVLNGSVSAVEKLGRVAR